MRRVVVTPDRRPCVVRRALVPPTSWQRLELEFDTGPLHGDLRVDARALPDDRTGYAGPRPLVDEVASLGWFGLRALVRLATAPVVVPARALARRPWLVEAVCPEPGGRRTVRLRWWVVGVRRSARFARDVAAALQRGELAQLVDGGDPAPAR